MNQMIATESNRPVYPLPGLDNMTATTEHSNATTIVAADYPSPTPLSPRRSALPRRRTPSQTSTTVPLPLENSSTRSLDDSDVRSIFGSIRQRLGIPD